MFGNSNNNNGSKKEANKSSATASPSGHSLNSLVKGTVVEGSVRSESDFRVDGTIKGKLFCDAKVIIGPTGLVDGEIRCKNAVIEGKFQGVLDVSELLNVRESANISGDVNTNKLIIQSGAVFNVSCTMGDGVKKAGFNSTPTNAVNSTIASSSDKQTQGAKAGKPAGA